MAIDRMVSFVKRLLCLCIVWLLFSFGNVGYAQAKTLVYCAESAPDHFAPSLTISGATQDAISNTIYNKLIEVETGTANLIPGLAETWEISQDGLRYTFHLRKDVAFHTTDYFTPTRTFNADDVINSFQREWDKNHPYHEVNGSSYILFNSLGFPELLKEINRIDDYTVEFVLTKPDASFLANLTYTVIASKEYADQMLKEGRPRDFDDKPIGTGPFLFVDYQKNTTIRYKAHENYWRGRTPLDHLIFSITPEASTRFAKLRRGECHVMSYPNPTDLIEASQLSHIQVLETTSLNVGYLAFNTLKAPFDNPKVRQALNYATNKQAIIDSVFHGGAIPAKGPISPQMWSYDATIPDYPYDPERAKQMLKEEGITEEQVELWTFPIARPYNPNARKTAELIQADWQNVGIKVNIVNFEWSEYLERSLTGEHSLLLIGMNYGHDPNTYMHLQLSCEAAKGGFNRAEWCYAPYDKLVNDAKLTTDQKKRTKLYQKAQHIFHEQVPWVPIAHGIIYQPISRKVKNFIVDPTASVYFYGVDIEE